ncbi:uncharacterized protein LACBIDRAFT_310127 [Laccaria bicolor S238N-H82]|uniref:Predicted protein n=1 Tax=Laccaria bicolor (strain S238N-H82 / ATCC MYA-4686) TaxID=486041 RepID=B0DTV9_LACBS|nr:uncharacterized protein LACBIDRAFT_310127 [Laccaria bicolor S238N-H82]EDR01981.1 predicted protein [Laccaria bicolor S238N-H82]|eukprot:XP_001887372.1 predicted protein [Laccaria bicolor S238N-H82]
MGIGISGHGAVAFAEYHTHTTRVQSWFRLPLAIYMEKVRFRLFVLNALRGNRPQVWYTRNACTSLAVLYQDSACSSISSSDMVEAHAAIASHFTRCGCSARFGFDSHSPPTKTISITLSDSSRWLQ